MNQDNHKEQSSEKIQVSDAEIRTRYRIIFAVSLVLFLIALIWPIYAVHKHHAVRGKSIMLEVREVGKALKAPIEQYFSDGRGPRKERMKVFLALFLILLLAAGRYIPKNKKIIQWIITGFMVLVAIMAYHTESYDSMKKLTKGKFVQYWNVYHYYFGTKYFNELGYYYLYAYTIKAEKEGALKLPGAQSINDLFHYRRMSPEQILKTVEGREDFTPKRWKQFKKELRLFSKRFVPKNRWREMLKDHGYNGTPFQSFVGAVIGDLFPITSKTGRIISLGLDQYFLVIACLVVAWAFGFRWAVIVFTLFIMNWTQQTFTVGGYFRFDWFFATVIGFCLFSKGYLKWSAPFFAYAIMTRLFPMFLLLGPGVLWIRDWIRTRKPDKQLFVMYLMVAGFCILFFVLGTLNNQGFGAWENFYGNIRQHTDKHFLGPLRLGLKHLYIDDLSSDSIATAPRVATYNKQKTMYHVTQILLVGMYFLAVWRRNRQDAMLLSFVFIFMMIVLSRYYWATICLMFLLTPDRRFKSRLVFGDTLILFTIVLFYTFRFHETDRYTEYMVTTYTYLGYFIYITGSYLAEDGFAVWDRFRAWKYGREVVYALPDNYEEVGERTRVRTIQEIADSDKPYKSK